MSEGTIEYYEEHKEFVVVKKRLYVYIFRNNGQIPDFSTEKDLRNLPAGFATYLQRIKRDVIQSGIFDLDFDNREDMRELHFSHNGLFITINDRPVDWDNFPNCFVVSAVNENNQVETVPTTLSPLLDFLKRVKPVKLVEKGELEYQDW